MEGSAQAENANGGAPGEAQHTPSDHQAPPSSDDYQALLQRVKEQAALIASLMTQQAANGGAGGAPSQQPIISSPADATGAAQNTDAEAAATNSSPFMGVEVVRRTKVCPSSVVPNAIAVAVDANEDLNPRHAEHRIQLVEKVLEDVLTNTLISAGVRWGGLYTMSSAGESTDDVNHSALRLRIEQQIKRRYGSNNVTNQSNAPPRQLTVVGMGGIDAPNPEDTLAELFDEHESRISALKHVFDTVPLISVHPLEPMKTLAEMCPHSWEQITDAVKHHGYIGMYAGERHHKTWSKTIAMYLNMIMGIPTLLLVSQSKGQGKEVAASINKNIKKLVDHMPSTNTVVEYENRVMFLDGAKRGWKNLTDSDTKAWNSGQLVLATYKNTNALRHAREFMDVALAQQPISDRFYSIVVDEGDVMTNADTGEDKNVFQSLSITETSPLINAIFVTASALGVHEYLKEKGAKYLKIEGRPCEHIIQPGDLRNVIDEEIITFDKNDDMGRQGAYDQMLVEFMRMKEPSAASKSSQVRETEDYCISKGICNIEDFAEGAPKVARLFLDIAIPAVKAKDQVRWWRTQEDTLIYLTSRYNDASLGGKGLIGMMTSGEGTVLFKNGENMSRLTARPFRSPSEALEYIEQNQDVFGLQRPVYATSYRVGFRAFHFGSWLRPVSYGFYFVRKGQSAETMHQAGMRIGGSKHVLTRAGFSLGEFPKIIKYHIETFEAMGDVTDRLLNNDGEVVLDLQHPIREALFQAARPLTDGKKMATRVGRRLDLDEGGAEMDPRHRIGIGKIANLGTISDPETLADPDDDGCVATSGVFEYSMLRSLGAVSKMQEYLQQQLDRAALRNDATLEYNVVVKDGFSEDLLTMTVTERPVIIERFFGRLNAVDGNRNTCYVRLPDEDYAKTYNSGSSARLCKYMVDHVVLNHEEQISLCIYRCAQIPAGSNRSVVAYFSKDGVHWTVQSNRQGQKRKAIDDDRDDGNDKGAAGPFVDDDGAGNSAP